MFAAAGEAIDQGPHGRRANRVPAMLEVVKARAADLVSASALCPRRAEPFGGSPARRACTRRSTSR